jgi:hypothetical protein
MTTFISIFIVLWCIIGAALYVNAMINWGRIFNRYKHILFFVICGPLVWLIGAMYFLVDCFYESFYTRIRNWFIT